MQWFGRKFRNAPNNMLSESNGVDLGQHLGDWCSPELLQDDVPFPPHNPEATLVTSLQDFEFPVTSMFDTPPQNMHAPVLDLDIEHVYYPSTTPGHAALLLNVSLEWEDYLRLIDLLEELGIIQTGFAEATRLRGYSACRTPWTKKPPRPAAEPPF